MDPTTFIDLVQKIINEFYGFYTSMRLLQNIIERIEKLPMEEQLAHQKSIEGIKNTIKGYHYLYGINDHLTYERLRPLYYKLYYSIPGNLVNYNPGNNDILNPVVPKTTFADLIESLIKGFYLQYTTMESLQSIIKRLDQLPAEEQRAHQTSIDDIKNTIKGYQYHHGDQKLTSKQQKTLYHKLYYTIPDQFIADNHVTTAYPPKYTKYTTSTTSYPPTSTTSNTTSTTTNTKLNTLTTTSTTAYPPTSKIFNTTSTTNKKKLDKDEFIYDVVNTLLTNFRRNCLSSHCTNFVTEYFENLSILGDNVEQYLDIMMDVDKCLTEAGWDNTGVGGFKSEPDRITLIQQLQLIMDTYF